MKKSKSVLIFIPSIENGGVEKNLYLIANYLAKRNISVKILTSFNNNKKFFDRRIKIISLKYKDDLTNSRFLKTLITIFLFFKYCCFKNDVIFSFQSNLTAILLASIFNKKIIIRSNTSPDKYVKNSFDRIIFKFFFNFADEIIVNSHEFKKRFKSFFSITPKIVYNPFINKKCNKIKFPFFEDKKSLKIINVARLTDQKDHLTLLKAFKIVNKKIKSKLLIIGSGKNKTIIKHYIHKNNLHHSAKLISFQKNPYKYMNVANLFVLSSKFEGLPNVLLEALSLKKFVISSNCSTGPSEILSRGKAGYLFEVGNHKQLAKKILAHYKNQRKNKIMTNYGYLSLSRYDYKKNCEKYLNLILDYLKNEY